MQDQFGNQVPEDLVLVAIDLRKLTTDRQRDAYCSMIWYRPKADPSVALVSQSAFKAAMHSAEFTDYALRVPRFSGIDIYRGVSQEFHQIDWPD
jgi:hypothetical protein